MHSNDVFLVWALWTLQARVVIILKASMDKPQEETVPCNKLNAWGNEKSGTLRQQLALSSNRSNCVVKEVRRTNCSCTQYYVLSIGSHRLQHFRLNAPVQVSLKKTPNHLHVHPWSYFRQGVPLSYPGRLRSRASMQWLYKQPTGSYKFGCFVLGWRALSSSK